MRAEAMTMQQTAQEAQARSEAAVQLRKALEEVRQAQTEARDAQRDARQAGRLEVPPAPEGVIVRDGHVIVRDAKGNVLQDVYTGQTGSPPGGPRDMPPRVANVAYMFFVTIAVIAIGIPLVRAFGRWLDRRGSAPSQLPADITARLERIESAVETVAVEVERISEGQRFTSRLMAEMRQVPQLEGARAEGARIDGTRAEGVRAEGVRIPEPRR